MMMVNSRQRMDFLQCLGLIVPSLMLLMTMMTMTSVVVLGFAPLALGPQQRRHVFHKNNYCYCNMFDVPGVAIQQQQKRASSHHTSWALKDTVTLVFDGDYCGMSDPLPVGTTNEEAVAFLVKDSTRDLFFSVGGTRPIELLDMTPEFVDMWQNVTDYFNCDRKPTMDDILISANTTINFPGMKLITTSASGIFVMENPQTALPEYQAFLVAEQQTSKGLKPVVWLFNQLTGNANREKGKFFPSSGKAMSTVSVVEQESTNNNDNTALDDENLLSISFNVQFKVFVQFPATLMKLFPMSKEKTEEQGGKSIKKTISTEVDMALEAARMAFVESTTTTSNIKVEG